MSKISDQKIAKLYAEARRVAGVCFVPFKGFPDDSDVNALACALITAGLVKAGQARTIDRAGVDKQQDDLLAEQFGDN